MRIMLVLIALLLLAGCKSAGEKAEERYSLVSRDSDAQARCAESKRVADAYLSAGDEPKYRDWLKTSDGDCAEARLADRSNQH